MDSQLDSEGGAATLAIMPAAATLLTDADVESIFRDLEREGISIPRPSKVKVIPDEDPDGDPIYTLLVEFPAEIPAPEASWVIVRPFLTRARSIISQRIDYERPVVSDLVRLSEMTSMAE